MISMFYVADGITKKIPLKQKPPLDYSSDTTCTSLFITPVTAIEVTAIEVTAIEVTAIEVTAIKVNDLINITFFQICRS